MLGGPGSRDLTQRHAWPEHLLHGMGQACSQPPPSLQEDLPPSPILATGSGDLAHGWQLLEGPLQAHMRKSLEPSSGWGGRPHGSGTTWDQGSRVVTKQQRTRGLALFSPRTGPPPVHTRPTQGLREKGPRALKSAGEALVQLSDPQEGPATQPPPRPHADPRGRAGSELTFPMMLPTSCRKREGQCHDPP